MKKNVRTLVSLLLVIVAIIAVAAPALALSPSMAYKSSSGTYADATGEYDYSCKTGASLTNANATMSYEKSVSLMCNLDVEVEYLNAYYHKDVDDAVTGRSLSISCNNTVKVYVNGVLTTCYGSISSVTGTYRFGGFFSKQHTLS